MISRPVRFPCCFASSRVWRGSLATLAFFALAALPCGAGSLRTRFGDVAMDDVPIGETVSPLLPDGTGYTLVNDSDGPLSVCLSMERPTFCEPLPGHPLYKPLPSSCTVEFEPASFDLAPHATNAVLVKVTLPDDPALAGKGFEFWIRAVARSGQGGVALMSRVRLDTRALPPAAGAATPLPEGGFHGAPKQGPLREGAPARSAGGGDCGNFPLPEEGFHGAPKQGPLREGAPARSAGGGDCGNFPLPEEGFHRATLASAFPFPDSLHDTAFYPCERHIEELVDGAVSETQDLDSLCCQKGRPALVVHPSFVGVVLRAVQFHDEPCAVAVEIGDVRPDGLLPLEAHGKVAESVVPQMALLRRHVGTQVAGERNVFADVGEGHTRDSSEGGS